MPGVVPLEDAQNYYVDRLKQHAQDGWQALTSTAQQAPQQLAAAAPAAPQIDPNEIIQRLQQHAQQAWQDAQDQAQQAAQSAQQTIQQVQPSPQPQQQQQPLPTIDASDVTNRLQQHAQDTWKSLDAGVQQIGQGVQSFNQPPPQAPTPATQDASANAQATSAVIQPNQTSQPQPQADQGGPAPDRSMSYQDYARAAARKAGIDPNVFMAQIQQESGFNPAARSPAGAIGIAQFMPATAAGVHLDPTDPYASLDAAAAEDAKRLQQYEGDWGKTLASYNAGAGAVAQYGGIPPYKETQTYVSTIMGNAQKAADAAGTAISGAVQAGKQAVGDAASAVGTGAQNAVQGAQQAISNKLPDVSQFGDKQLTAAEAYAACGPAAAVRFAQMFGRNPSLREATDLASKVGWTAGSGMAGLQSESKLFDEMGIPHRTVGADWNALAKEASSGNPVTISTPGHYFTADSYDASTGAFHVGRSGLDLRVGKEWMTPAEMEAAMGKLQGGLAADNPQTPAPSPLAQPTTTSTTASTPRRFMGGLQDAAGNLASDASHAIGQGMQGVGQAIGGTLQTVDNAVQSAASQATAPATLKPGEESATSTLSAAATNAAPAVQAGTQAAQDTLRKVPGPFGVSTVGDIADTAGNIAGKVQTPDENAPGGVVGRAVGTGLSALGSAAQEATAALDKINVASNLARDATGSDQYNNLYAQAGGPALEDEYRTLLQQRMNGDDSVSPRMTAIVNQLQSINDGIRGGTSRQDQGELNQRLSEQNPLTGSAVGLANVGAAGLATVLAAGDAPLALRAVAEVLQPGTNPLEIARALTAVNDAKGVAPEVANAVDQAWQRFGGRLTDTAAERAQQIAKLDDSSRTQLVQAITNPVRQLADAGVGAASKVVSALSDLMKPDIPAPQLEQAIKTVNETTASVPDIIDQVRKMPGTAELAPVRQQVPQSSTDLLQAMLDAARAKGVDPEKLSALEQQITDMDPTAATRRGLGDLLTGESGAVPLTAGTLRAGTTLGGAVAGGAAGYATTPDDAGRPERAMRTLAGAGIGAGVGSFRGNLADVGRSAQAARIGSLAGGIPTLGHIALNTPVQIGLKLASDLGANLRYPEANAAELYGAMQGLRHWGMNAATTLTTPGPLSRSMGGGAGSQALETGLVGLVKAHPLLQDIPRQMASQMELYRTAAQAATDAGLPRLGTRWRAEVARLVASPTAAMTSAAKSAGDTAALAGPMGTTGQAMADLIKKSPIARFAVPIFDIGYKVASQGVEMTPLGTAGILADIGRRAIGEGPYAGAAGFGGRGAADAVTPLAQRVRNNLIGLALMYEGYQQAAQGNITGEGPADPGKQAELRQTGWQADSVKIGGRYFNAHLLGPLGWPLIAGANTFESVNGPGGQGLEALKTPQGERAPGALDMLGDMVARQGRYFNNETFLNSLGSALNLIGSSSQQGKVPASEAANVLQSLIPQGALLANLALEQDPYQRNPKAGANPLEDIQNQLASRLPDNPWTPSRSQLQPRLTATGKPMPNPQEGLGLLMPRSSVANPDPILEEMQHTGVVPTNVPTTVPYGTTGEVQMTPSEQYTWQQYRGAALQQLAGDLIDSPGYKEANLQTQRNLLARVNSAASAQASRFVTRDIITSPAGATRRMPTGKQAPVQSYEPAG